MPTTPTYEEILAQRLAELSRPENQGEGLRQREFVRLFVICIVVPIIALVLGWFL